MEYSIEYLTEYLKHACTLSLAVENTEAQFPPCKLFLPPGPKIVVNFYHLLHLGRRWLWTFKMDQTLPLATLQMWRCKDVRCKNVRKNQPACKFKIEPTWLQTSSKMFSHWSLFTGLHSFSFTVSHFSMLTELHTSSFKLQFSTFDR